MKKRSFFERLAGHTTTMEDPFDDELPVSSSDSGTRASGDLPSPTVLLGDDETPKGAGELPVDVHQTGGDIVIRAFVAGVRPDELNISISRDMVEIEGTRSEREQVSNGDYFTQELFWGSFSRTILLPQEIDVDASTANAKDGLLTIVLPLLDKAKQTKLKVKAG